jgi:aminopeptidase N
MEYPEEPTDEELEAEESTTVAARDQPIEIKGLTAASVEGVILGALRGNWRLDERINEAIDNAVEKVIARLATETVQAKLSAIADAALAAGIVEYDTYSGKPTKRTSLAEYIQAQLKMKSNDSYSSDRGKTVLDKAVAAAITQVFDKDLKAEREAVAARFRQEADDLLKAKLVQSLRDAIGLK